MRFKEINFGLASAERESVDFPILLIEGYLDYGGASEESVKGSKFIFLGYKGSGKSALGQHLKLKADAEPSLFVNHLFLSDFPYTSFSKIISGDIEPEAKYPAAWSWILFIYLLASFQKDEGAASSSDPEYLGAIRALSKLGILPVTNLRDIVIGSSKKTFKINLPMGFEGVFESSSPSSNDMNFFQLVENLKQLVIRFDTDSNHIVIIDGLDDILSSREVQYKSLAALVLEVSRLNALFKEHKVKAKVLLLCRTELFERLPGPNKNKIRQDSAVELDWYHDTRDPRNSKLVGIAELRAKIAGSTSTSIFDTFFPAQIEGKNVLSFLLDMTRHTPRDFLQLLSHIQKFDSNGKISVANILSGLRDYSINYFLPEIRDELVGYVTPEDIDNTIRILSKLRKRDFYISEVRAIVSANAKYQHMDIEHIFETLFECSAIGNISNRPTGTTFFSFKYRNRNSSLDIDDRIILHRGLWKALNLV